MCGTTVFSSGGLHAFSYDLAWRLLTDPSRRASPAICGQLGHSVKSAVAYDFNWDERDGAGRPKSGRALRLHTELGGLSPDASVLKYAKQQVDVQYAVPLVSVASLYLGLTAGMAACGLRAPGCGGLTPLVSSQKVTLDSFPSKRRGPGR